MGHSDCEISILMPVFDTPAKYLAECWDSIHAQTFTDWELVLIDDGSRTAETVAEIDRIAKDPRVALFRLDRNEGVARALNVGLSKCRADLVARMDADDRMMPRRLERQLRYLRARPDVSVLGTQLREIEWQTNRLLSPTQHPAEVTREYIEYQRRTSEVWFLNHPTVMLRQREVMRLGGYPEYRVAQDLALWLRLIRAGLKIHNLPTVELHYRLHPNQASILSGARRQAYAQVIEECWESATTIRK